MEELRRKNIYYQSNKGKSFTVSLYKAAVSYTKWKMFEPIEPAEKKNGMMYFIKQIKKKFYT